MADLMMPGPPDVPQGYGSAGASAFYGLQTELLRRAALERQARLDAEQQQKDQLAAEMARENLATSKLLRESTAAENTAKTNKLGLEAATAGLTSGADLTPEQKAPIIRFGGSSLVKSTPGAPAMTEGVPSQFALPPDAAAAPEVSVTDAVPAKDTYVGSADQQLLAQHRDYAQKVVKALEDKQAAGGELSPIEQEQLYEGHAVLMTGKSATAPAGVIVPKSTPVEKLADAYNKLKTKQLLGKEPLTAEEMASVKAFEAQHPTEAQKQNDRIEVVIRNQTATDTRQGRSQLFTQKQQFRKDLGTEEAKLAPDLERVDRAQKVLNSPNFLADAIAAPEVLQIMAGGMGSGLRMTDAELNRVNGAQTKLDQLRGVVAKYGLGTPVTIQADMRAQMKALIETVQKARERHQKLLEDTRSKISDADSPEDLDHMVAAFWGKKTSVLRLDGTDVTPAPSKYKVTVE